MPIKGFLVFACSGNKAYHLWQKKEEKECHPQSLPCRGLSKPFRNGPCCCSSGKLLAVLFSPHCMQSEPAD